MASTPNNTLNVSVGKGLQGGYCFIAPAGTNLPKDNKSELDAAFMNVGYLGEDGVNFADSSNSDSFYDMNGDTIDTSNGSVEKNFTVKFVEIKRDTLAIIRGEENVADENGLITAYDRGPNDANYAAVFELLLKNGRKWRRVVPNCKIGELGDMAVNYSELVGREVTMAALKDATANAYYVDYIDSTETTATAQPAAAKVARAAQ